MSFEERGLNPAIGLPPRHATGGLVNSCSDARTLMAAAGIRSCEVCGWRFPECVTQDDEGGDLLHVHHILPRHAGGRNVTGNLVLLCQNCHRVAHRIFPLQRSRKTYAGPVGRSAFLVEMRLFWADPEYWWRHRRRRVTASVVGPWETTTVKSGLESGI
jgi:hypothetical protein